MFELIGMLLFIAALWGIPLYIGTYKSKPTKQNGWWNVNPDGTYR